MSDEDAIRPPRSRLFPGPAPIPYAVEEVAGARRLVVVFPKLNPGGTGPPRRIGRRLLGDVPVHRLYVGADPDIYIGPGREMRGFATVLALLPHVAQELGVELGDTVTTGTSMGAACATAFGLAAGAGEVIVGGLPVRLGHHLSSFRQVEGPTGAAKASAKRFIALARTDRTPEKPQRFLDGLLPLMAQESRRTRRLSLFASRRDRFWTEMERLHRTLAEHPTLRCELTEGTYGPHRLVLDGFPPFLRAQLGHPHPQPGCRPGEASSGRGASPTIGAEVPSVTVGGRVP